VAAGASLVSASGRITATGSDDNLRRARVVTLQACLRAPSPRSGVLSCSQRSTANVPTRQTHAHARPCNTENHACSSGLRSVAVRESRGVRNQASAPIALGSPRVILVPVPIITRQLDCCSLKTSHIASSHRRTCALSQGNAARLAGSRRAAHDTPGDSPTLRARACAARASLAWQGQPPWSSSSLRQLGSAAQRSAAQRSAAQRSTAQHSTAQHSTAQHSTAQHSTAQHSTAQRVQRSHEHMRLAMHVCGPPGQQQLAGAAHMVSLTRPPAPMTCGAPPPPPHRL
jgi:hypothetical protein